MMKLVLAYYDLSVEALGKGAEPSKLYDMPVREQIGRFKYTLDKDVDTEFQKVMRQLNFEIAEITKGEED